MLRILTLTCLSLAICASGCQDSDNEIALSGPGEPPMTKNDSVIANCYIVQAAADAYAAANNGVYPTHVSEDLPDGRILFDFLPNRGGLVNPYTGLRSEPRNGYATQVGSTGYGPRTSVGTHGYHIDGLGADWEQLVYLIREAEVP